MGWDDEVTDTGPIETKEVSDVRETPYVLPGAYEWYCVDLTNDQDVTFIQSAVDV